MSEDGTTTTELPGDYAAITTSRAEREVIRRSLKLYASAVHQANTKNIKLGIANPLATRIKEMLYPPVETGRSALVARFLVEGDRDEPEEREKTPKGDPAQLSIDDETAAANGHDGTPDPVRSGGNFRKGGKRGSGRGHHPGGGLSA